MDRRQFGLLTLSAMVASPFSALAQEGRAREALVIGIDDYRELRRLYNAGADARAVAEALEKIGFGVDLVLDPTLNELSRSIERFTKRTDRDISLVYYAGHGFEVRGHNSIIPVDVRTESIDALYASVVSIDSIMRDLADNGGTNIVILDACRNFPFVLDGSQGGRSATPLKEFDPLPSFAAQDLPPQTLPGEKLPGEWGETPERSSTPLALTAAASDLTVMFSTSPDDVADDGSSGHSPFATAFLNALADARDTEIVTLFSRVTGEVYSTTDQRQRPWMNSSLTGAVFLGR